jgi:hypothetical protein
MKVIFNPVHNEECQLINENTLTEYINTDPTSPADGDMWVKRTVAVDGVEGTPRGLLLALTYSGNGISNYELSFKTINDDIKRVTLN